MLLAKSRNKDGSQPRGYTLAGHLEECLAMCLFLFEGIDFGAKLHEVMNLAGQGIPYLDFRFASLAAVLLHDIGKAGSEFAAAIEAANKKLPFYEQAYRHELLSLYALRKSPLRDWLRQISPYSAEIEAAVFGHHVKFDRQINPGRHPTTIYTAALTELSPHLQQLSLKYLGTSTPEVADLKATYKVLAKVPLKVDPKLTDTPISTALKWLTIISDVLGSMTPRDGSNPQNFRKRLQEELKEALAPRWENYSGRALLKLGVDSFSKCKLHTFQQEAKDTDGSILVEVACSGGKTVAALLWADRKPELKLVITTPTTSTASALFDDYRMDRDTVRHTRAIVDAVLARNGQKEEKGPADIQLLQTYNDIVSGVAYSTVDQVLGCLGFNRRSILWLLRLVYSQIIFDEVHAYDESLSEWHKKFLDWFPGIRVAVLSATVRPHQRRYLCNSRKLVHLSDRRTGQNAPARLERYFIRVVTQQEAIKLFRNAAGALWVANTRPDVQGIARQFPNAAVLHSALKYQDRQARQKALISGFDRPGERHSNPMQAIATQVAEMSLDLSARVLFSSLAPVYAMIQRLGRLARFISSGSSFFQKDGLAFFYMPEHGYPYVLSRDWMPTFQSYLKWLLQFDGRWVSQQDLLEEFNKIPNHLQVPTRDTMLYKSNRVALRDMNGSITGILEDDVAGLGPNPLNYEVQLLEIPAYLNQDEHAACAAMPSIRNRPVFPKSHFNYDNRLGLLHKRHI